MSQFSKVILIKSQLYWIRILPTDNMRQILILDYKFVYQALLDTNYKYNYITYPHFHGTLYVMTTFKQLEI